MEQMYDIVADVDKYKDFVPWCTSSKVTYRRAGMCRADLEIGFPPLVERYTSSITLARPQLVKVKKNCLQKLSSLYLSFLHDS